MRIIIIGAGIGGASAGIALQRLGHDVEIVEQVRENRPVGAALSLWSNGVKVLNWLGLGAEVAALGGTMDWMSYEDGLGGETLCRFSLAPVRTLSGQRPYPVARADLQALLMETFGLERIRFGTRAVGVEQVGEEVVVTFDDGSTATADLLIGADGAKSLVRAYVVGEDLPRTYAGYTNFNGLVPQDPRIGPADQWTTYIGEGKRCSVMPVAGDRFYFFVDIPQPAGVPFDRADGIAPLREAFGHWTGGVQALLDSIDPAVSFNRVEIWDLDPFTTWVRGRVAILGDAAHNTAPDIGQGACSALEDTFALATAIAAHGEGVEDALRRYEGIRVQRAGDLVLRARKRGHETHGADPELTARWVDGLRGTDGEGIIRGIVGNIEGSPIDLGLALLD